MNISPFYVLLLVAAALFVIAFVIAVGWISGNVLAFLSLGLAVFAVAGLWSAAVPRRLP